MAINPGIAIESARHFELTRGCKKMWDEASIEVYPDIIEGRHAWVVKTTEAMDPNEIPFIQYQWPPVLYFVDACSGAFFGFATERSRTMFNASEKIPTSSDNSQKPICNNIIDKHEAIESARNFELKKGCVKDWDDPHIKITPEIIEGRHAWVVAAYDVLLPGEEPWMMMLVQPTLYFVDACTGELFGVGGERFRQIFKLKEP